MGQEVPVDKLADALKSALGPVIDSPSGPMAIPDQLGNRIGLILAGDMKGHFNRSASPDGQAWAPIQPRPQGGSNPLLNKGTFRNSITGRAEPDGASAGTNAIQANLMNSGGTIRPTQAKMLAIPITREANIAGSPRKFPRTLFIIKSKKGNLLLVESKVAKGAGKSRRLNANEKKLAEQYGGDSGGIVAHYRLTTSVKIKARPFNGFTPQAIDDATQIAIEYFVGSAA